MASELATATEKASAYLLELASASALVTASASALVSLSVMVTATVLRLVSESPWGSDSDSVAALRSRWFQARRIVRTLTTARESRITNRISFLISVPSPGLTSEAAERGELNTEAEATETAIQACGSSPFVE